MRIGLVIAETAEAEPFIHKLNMVCLDNHGVYPIYVSKNVILIVCNTGKLNAYSATRMLIDMGCTHIINAGTCAGRDVPTGTVTRPAVFYDGDFDLRVFGRPKYYVPQSGTFSILSDTHNPYPIYSISHFSPKDEMMESGKHLIDMESYGVLHACKMRNLEVPCDVFKIVSDSNLDIGTNSEEDFRENLEKLSDKLSGEVLDYMNLLLLSRDEN